LTGHAKCGLRHQKKALLGDPGTALLTKTEILLFGNSIQKIFDLLQFPVLSFDETELAVGGDLSLSVVHFVNEIPCGELPFIFLTAFHETVKGLLKFLFLELEAFHEGGSKIVWFGHGFFLLTDRGFFDFLDRNLGFGYGFGLGSSLGLGHDLGFRDTLRPG
jgi:hypothetical protein